MDLEGFDFADEVPDAAPAVKGPGARVVPTVIKKLQGSYKPHRDNGLEPIPTTPAMCPPSLFAHSVACGYWQRLVESAPPGLYTGMDTLLMEALCKSAAIAEDAWQQLQTGGLTICDDKGNEVPNPIFNIYTRATDTISRLAPQLALSPVSRAKMGIGREISKAKQHDIMAVALGRL